MDTSIQEQYATGLSRRSIEQALLAAGKSLPQLCLPDLRMLEDFHTMGRIATAQLVDLLHISNNTRVLDAGSGIGGTARYVADRYGCPVTAVDLTDDYCETSRWLNRLVGLDGRISVYQGDVTSLPFGNRIFDVVISQHVQMNVADKPRLYAEAHRVLAPGGQLALWDITAGEPGELNYPLPWADQPHRSTLVTAEELHGAVRSAGFTVELWNDLTEQAATFMQALLEQPGSPLGLHSFVPDFGHKAANLTAALADGRLRAIQCVARAHSSGN